MLTPSIGPARTWTDKSGRRVEAEFVDYQNATATLKRTSDGRVFSVAAASLIEADQEILKRYSKFTPETKIIDDKSGHGWDVRVSFRNSPEKFGRAAHVWTIDRAKELADQLEQNHAELPDLSIAKIQIQGRDGDGKVTAEQGPHLPDWVLVEQRFRARVTKKSESLDKQLAGLKQAYEEAAEPTAEVLRDRKPITTEREKLLKKAYENYNAKVDELERLMFDSVPQPLPRLQIPEPDILYEHITAWPDAKLNQFLVSGVANNARQLEPDLSAFTKSVGSVDNKRGTSSKTIEFDDSQPKRDASAAGPNIDKSSASASNSRSKSSSIEGKADELDQILKTVDEQLNSIENLLVDSSRIAPQADAFVSEPGGAVYKSAPQVEIRKTDANGKDLPDEQQPKGYPKPFLRNVKLDDGEGVFVDPSLRVQLKVNSQGAVSREIRASVFGRVTEIDSVAGKVAMQVDRRGTRIVLSGIRPQGIKVGDYVEPNRTIGQSQPSMRQPNVFEFFIRALNSSNRLVAPGPVLDYGRLRPSKSGELDRKGADLKTEELPVKATSGDGKPEDQARVTFDDSAEKGANLKEGALAARELIAQKELDAAKKVESSQVDKVGELSNKLRQIESESKAAIEKLNAIESDGDDALAAAGKLNEREKELLKEQSFLTNNKQRLDALGASARESDVNDHNNRFNKLVEDAAALTKDKKALSAKVAELQREMSKQEKLKLDLTQDLGKLESSEKTAKSELEKARNDVKSREDELQRIAKERKELSEVKSKEKKSTTPAKIPSANQDSSNTPKGK